jgi:hypothetical protein
MKWVSYCWAVVVGALTLGVAALLVGRFDAPFERAVIAILLLVWASLESSMMGRGLVLIAQGRTDRARFMELLEAANPRRHRELADQLAEEGDGSGQAQVTLYIRSGFLWVIRLVAVWSLLTAVM